MHLRIFWVGKTKADFLARGIEYYLGLLRGHARVSVWEIKEEKGMPRHTALLREGARIMRQADSFALLDESGKHLSSRDFALFLSLRKSWDLVLGGPYGVSQEVRYRAEHVLSLSRMTLTHEMARLLLIEQLFRSFTILKNTGYHH